MIQESMMKDNKMRQKQVIKDNTVRQNTMHLKRPAFTMLELVFVIVVLGILASMAIPRLDRDLRQGAKDNILAAIRLTQNIALVDNKTDPTDPTWQRKLWTIRFSVAADNLATFYTVSSDTNANGSISQNETVPDPANGKFMYNANGDTTIDDDESPSIFIGKKYGIDTMNFSGGCSNAQQHIAFDHLGRPYNGISTATNDYSTYMASDCNITIAFIDTSITPLNITVATETGFATGD
jgi:prepilin-type N-terminal cleavage/methylation domain-containing protein